MNREELKTLGLTDEQIEAVMKSHGKSVNELKEQAGEVDTLQSQIDDYKQQLTERDTQLEELKKVDAEGLQAKIDELQTANEKAETEYEEKLHKQAFDFKLKEALVDARVRNPKAVQALLDVESIKLDGDKLLNLDNQLETLKESDAYLFGEEEPAGLRGRSPNQSQQPPAQGNEVNTLAEMRNKQDQQKNQAPDLWA